MEYKYLFISGLHRSGTSIFFKILKETDNISGFENTGVWEDEGQHLQTVFKTAMAYGGPGKFGFRKGAYLDENSPLVTTANREKLLQEWQPYWDLGKSYLVEKSPPNLIRTRFLQAMFPDSVFITIMRHPLAVSLATQKWSKTTMGSLLRHWLHCHRIFETDSPHLEKVYVFKYEDFVQQPEKTLSEMAAALSIDLNTQPKLKLRPEINEKYLERWEKNYVHHPIRKYYANYLIKKYEADLNHFGYSLKPPYLL